MAVWEKSRRSRDAAGGSEQFWSSGIERTILEQLE